MQRVQLIVTGEPKTASQRVACLEEIRCKGWQASFETIQFHVTHPKPHLLSTQTKMTVTCWGNKKKTS